MEVSGKLHSFYFDEFCNNLVILFRELTFQEAQYSIAILNSDDKSLVAETLISIANCAAFTINQNTFREAGLVAILPKLILNPNRQIKLKAFLVVSNMALNEKNNNGIFHYYHDSF